MGYETRLNVVRKSNYSKEYGNRIAVFNLACVYDVSEAMRKYPATEIKLYPLIGEGGNMLETDCYGERLHEVPIDDAIDILRNAMRKDTERNGELYWRWKPCLALLEAFEGMNDIVVLHYGY